MNNLIQFESGHGIGPGTEGLGTLVPLFTIRKRVALTALAGEDAPHAAEPVVTVDTTRTVQVTWRLFRPNDENDGLIVAVRSVVLLEKSEPFLESELYDVLVDYESPVEDRALWDFGAWARKAHGELVALHGKYVSLQDDDAIPNVPDPGEDPGEAINAGTPVRNRIASMIRVLEKEKVFLGTFDERNEDGERIVAEGLIELRHALADLGLELENALAYELTRLPIIDEIGDEMDGSLDVARMFGGTGSVLDHEALAHGDDPDAEGQGAMRAS